MKRKLDTEDVPEEELAPFASVVYELGSWKVSAGMSGALAPTEVVPADGVVTGRRRKYGLRGLSLPNVEGRVENLWSWDRQAEETQTPNTDSLRVDAALDAMRQLLEEDLRCVAAERPAVFVDPPCLQHAERKKLVEGLLEGVGVPAVAFAQDAPCVTYATGSSVALVVDAGHRSSRFTAVYDGCVLHRSSIVTSFGGCIAAKNWMQATAEKLAAGKKGGKEEEKGQKEGPEGEGPQGPSAAFCGELQVMRKLHRGEVAVTTDPHSSNLVVQEQTHLSRLLAAHSSYHDYVRMRSVHFMMDSLALSTQRGSSRMLWQLPDGQEVFFTDKDRSKLGGICFHNASEAQSKEAFHSVPHSSTTHSTVPSFSRYVPTVTADAGELKGLRHAAAPFQAIVRASVLACDPTLRDAMLETIIVKGGLSLMPGFRKKLEDELRTHGVTAKAAVKTHHSITAGPKDPFVPAPDCTSWLGASILSSTAAFTPSYITKAEWDEQGSAVVDTRTSRF